MYGSNHICSHQIQAQERSHECMQDLRASPFEGRRLGYSADAEVGRPASGDIYDGYGIFNAMTKMRWHKSMQPYACSAIEMTESAHLRLQYHSQVIVQSWEMQRGTVRPCA